MLSSILTLFIVVCLIYCFFNSKEELFNYYNPYMSRTLGLYGKEEPEICKGRCSSGAGVCSSYQSQQNYKECDRGKYI